MGISIRGKTGSALAVANFVGAIFLGVLFGSSVAIANAQESGEGAPLLRDVNGDGSVNILAFGDSLTRGVGDFTSPDEEDAPLTFPEGEAGYPLRVERLLGVGVENFGSPGEQFNDTGLQRYIDALRRSFRDIAIFSEGANDARTPISGGTFFNLTQLAVNVTRAMGSQPVLMTIVPTCCGHSFLSPSIDLYNGISRAIAIANEIPIADVNRGYRNTCNVGSCYLLNLQEGLHPNSEGYDVMGEIVAATLLQINIFAPDGPALLAQALGLPPGSIKTVPDPVISP